MKTCENAVKNMWNTLWQVNTLWKTLWILHSLNFEKISKFRTLWKISLWKTLWKNLWSKFKKIADKNTREKTYEKMLRKLLKTPLKNLTENTCACEQKMVEIDNSNLQRRTEKTCEYNEGMNHIIMSINKTHTFK